MKYYRVLLNGENFLIRLDGKKELMGFYTTRFVSAVDPDDAELKSVEMLRKEEKLSSIMLNKSWQSEKPMIFVEEMYEITKEDMENDHGYGWYSMRDKE